MEWCLLTMKINKNVGIYNGNTNPQLPWDLTVSDVVDKAPAYCDVFTSLSWIINQKRHMFEIKKLVPCTPEGHTAVAVSLYLLHLGPAIVLVDKFSMNEQIKSKLYIVTRLMAPKSRIFFKEWTCRIWDLTLYSESFSSLRYWVYSCL